MAKLIQMYCGAGKGKTSAAFGRGFQAACEGKSVFIVSFLKGKGSVEPGLLRRLEPEIKLFTFDKFSEKYSELSESEKREEQIHVQNGLNFARKVMVTEECDMLILDEILELADRNIVPLEEIIHLLEQSPDNMDIILTGTGRCERLWPYVDQVIELEVVKENAV